MSNRSLDALTAREKEILALIAEGLSLVEIAHKLHRSQKTIESHRLAIGRKLNASNRVELAKIAISAGLVNLEDMHPHGMATEVPDESHQELDWLKKINDIVYNTTGQQYLQRFCRVASTLPGVDIAAICTIDTSVPPGNDPMNRLVMASAIHGEDGESMQYYCAADTPCNEVIQKGCFQVAEGVAKAFPQDPWLKKVGADSYFGTQLIDEEGNAVGGIALVGQKPIEHSDMNRRIIEFFVPRLAAMLKTCLQIDALREENSQLVLRSVITAAGVTGPELLPRSSSEAITQILDKVQHLAGVRFLRGLIDAVCDVFSTEYAGLCEIDRESPDITLQSLFFRTRSGQGDPLRYKAKGTPCDDVLKQGMVSIARDAKRRYANDAFFLANQIETYVGMRLSDTSHHNGDLDVPLGVMWMLDSRPLDDAKTIEDVFQYFAPRVSAELEGLKAYEALLQDRESLEQKLASIEDA